MNERNDKDKLSIKVDLDPELKTIIHKINRKGLYVQNSSTISAVNNVIKYMNETRSLTSSLYAAQAAINSLNEVTASLRPNIDLYMATAKAPAKAIESLQSSLIGIRFNKEYMSSISLIAENLSEVTKNLNLNNIISNFQNLSLSIQERLDKSEPLSLREVNKIKFNELVTDTKVIKHFNIINESTKTIVVDNEKFDLINLEDMIYTRLEESGIFSLETKITTSINKLIDISTNIEENTSKKNSFVQGILIGIIIYLLTFFTQPYTLELREDLYKNKNKIIKEIKKEVNAIQIDKSFYNTYRFVKKESLIVRQSSTIKSKALYTLSFQDTVEVIYKNRNWTKVKYINKEINEQEVGWVFTKYISRFD